MAYGFIYITTNNVNGKKYIGQKRYDDRGVWKRYLGSGILITEAIKKYGAENFTREIICDAYSPESLNILEEFWIEYYDAVQSENFYNIAPGGNVGHKTDGYSEEERSGIEAYRIEKCIEGTKKFRDSKTPSELVFHNTLSDSDVLEIIPRLIAGECRTDIAKDYGVSVSTIYSISRHKSWTWLTEGIEFPDMRRDHYKPHGEKRVYQYNLFGEFIAEYKSAAEAGRILGIDNRLISGVCAGKCKTTNGYLFSFEPLHDIERLTQTHTKAIS